MNIRWAIWDLLYRARGMHICELYGKMMENQWRPQADLVREQQDKLDKVLRHAVKNVPYYRKQNLKPELSSFKPLTKLNIQMHTQGDLRADDWRARKTWIGTSSGSTGQPTCVLLDKQAHTWRTATGWRGDSFGGIHPTDRFVTLWWRRPGETKLKRFTDNLRPWLYNLFVFDNLVTTRENVEWCHTMLHKLRPRMVYGFAAGIVGYVRFALELGLRPPDSIVKVMSTGEHITESQAEMISEYFGVRMSQRFGTSETGDIGHQCEHGTWHMHPEHVFLEVLHDDGTIHRTGKGRVLVTTLNNYTMPLIRYDLGDVFDLTPVECQCNRGLPTFTSVIGRSGEFVYCPGGRWVSSLAFAGYMQRAPVWIFRVVQDEIGHMEFLIVPKPEFDEAARMKLLDYCNTVLDGQVKVDIQMVEDIPPLPNGKHKLVINEIEIPDKVGL